MKGIVKRIESKDVYVFAERNEYRCSIRGKLKLETEFKEEKYTYKDIVIVGDFVEFHINEDGTGVISEIPERRNYISRKTARIKGTSEKGKRGEQIIAANIDQTLCVGSITKPVFNNRVIDRFIVISESCKAVPIIIINKTDLDKSGLIEEWEALYNNLGYKVILTSTKTKKGIKELSRIIKGKTNLFLGHSGVGKSSLINLLGADINQKVGEISTAWQKGKHTTVTSSLIDITDDTFVIDTPGVKEVEPYGISKNDITYYFREIAKYAGDCKFNTCTHTHEPGCNVKDAVESDKIHIDRYESYLRLIESIDEDLF